MECDKGLKLLLPGRRSFRDNSAWQLGEWRHQLGDCDGQPCGSGLHMMVCGDPLQSPVFRWPCVVWTAEAFDPLGHDKTKARYAHMRIIRNVTHRFPPIVRVNRFIRSIPDVRWLQPQAPEEWMVVKEYRSVTAAWDAAGAAAWDAAGAAARDAAGDAARDAAGDAARDAAGDAARDAAWDAARAAAGDAARDAAGDAARDAAWDAARAAAGDAAGAAAWDAAGAALALMVVDLDVDTTWLWRWWRAWELGYYPLEEDGDKLVVARIAWR